jgi:hypothetical protein
LAHRLKYVGKDIIIRKNATFKANNLTTIDWNLYVDSKIDLSKVKNIKWNLMIIDSADLSNLECIDWDLFVYIPTELTSLTFIGGTLHHHNGEFKANKLTKVDWKAYVPSED